MSEFSGHDKLEELRKKQPSELSESDRAFLTARRSYLHAHEKSAFGIPHDEAEQEEQTEDEESETVKPVKKPKAKAKDEAEQE